MRFFEQRSYDNNGLIDRFYLKDSNNEKRPQGHSKLFSQPGDRYDLLKIGEGVQFSGTTYLQRIR